VVLLQGSERRRLGVTVTRKVTGAVGRNRVRRLCREVFRRNPALFPERCDVVMIARRDAQLLDYATVAGELSAARAALSRAARRLQRPMPVAQGPS
jgi:ribonuclease P protein component